MISLEYLAGVLDVSGSLCLTNRSDRGERPTVILLIQNDDRTLPDMFSKRWGGLVTEVSLKSDRARFTWSKRGKMAQRVLREVRPYIKVRMREFDRLLAVPIRNRGAQPYLTPRDKSIGTELMRAQA